MGPTRPTTGLAVTTPTAVSWLQLPALNPGSAVDAAGESHYQHGLESIAGGRTCFGVRTPLITAELLREPTWGCPVLTDRAGGLVRLPG
jgi:hypothetical protein